MPLILTSSVCPAPIPAENGEKKTPDAADHIGDAPLGFGIGYPIPRIASNPEIQPFAQLRAQDYVFRAIVSLPLSHKTLILQEYFRLFRDRLKWGGKWSDFFSTQLHMTCTFS